MSPLLSIDNLVVSYGTGRGAAVDAQGPAGKGKWSTPSTVSR